MQYREFEFYTSPNDGVEKSPAEYFCEIYHASDDGLANLLDCFCLKEGRDIPVNFEPGLITAVQRYVDVHYDELMAAHNGQEIPKKIDYLQQFLHNTDFDLLYKQKQALLNAQEHHLPVDEETIEGLVNFLDFIGDWAEQEGVFQYPNLEEKPSFLDELICLAKEDLEDAGKISYVAPDNEYIINITIERGSEDSMNPGKEFFWLELLQPTENGFHNTFSGGTDYNDFKALSELAESAINYWNRRKLSLKPDLSSQIAAAANRTSTPSSNPGKAPEPEIF